MKNLLSTAGKKVTAFVVLLLVVAGIALGLNYRTRSNEELRGDFQFVLNTEPVKEAPEIKVAQVVPDLELKLQPAAEDEEGLIVADEKQDQPEPNDNPIEFQVSPNLVGDGGGIQAPENVVDPTINVIPPFNIDGLPIADQSKVSVWLASGQGMKHDGNKLTKWEDLSGNGRHVVAEPGHEPQISKFSGADCSDFNCQYGVFFDGFDDNLKSVKDIDKVQEMFIVFDLGPKTFAVEEDSPIINFNRKATFQNVTAELPSNWKNNQNINRTGLNVAYKENLERFDINWDNWGLSGCVNNNNNLAGCNINVPGTAFAGMNYDVKDQQMTHPILVHFKTNANGKAEIRVNGGQNVATQDVNNTPAYDLDTDFYLGARGPDDPFGRFFNGKIGEVIILNEEIDSTDRSKVESYLTTKFGISKGDASFGAQIENPNNPVSPFLQPPGDQAHSFPAPANSVDPLKTNYSYGIVGMGRLDSIALVAGAGSNSFSTSTGRQQFLSMGKAAGLDNGDFVYAGHNIDKNDEGVLTFPNRWTDKMTAENVELLTRVWQMKRKGSVDSFVMSVKLTPENQIPQNIGNSMIFEDKMIVEEPVDRDYAIALFDDVIVSNDVDLEGESAKHYGLLRDDGQLGDLVANDNIYSTKLTGSNINGVDFFTVVRGPEGSFDPEDPGPNGPGDDAPPEDPEDPGPFVPGDKQDPDEPEDPAPQGDNAVDLEIRTQVDGEQGFSNVPISYNNAPFSPTTEFFFDQNLDDLIAPARTIVFQQKPGFTTPGTLTIANQRIDPIPEDVYVYVNNLNTSYTAGTPFTEDDHIIILGSYETDDGLNGNEIFFRLVTEEEEGGLLNEGYTYNGEPYVPTPDLIGKQVSDFGTQPGLLTKKIGFEPKEGFVTPGELVIDERKISEYPKNVEVFIDGDQVPYPLNDASVFQAGNTMFIKGIYLEAADLTVEMDGPNGFPGGNVEVGEDEEFIPNNNEETFNVDPDEDAEVICPEVNGYNLLSENPIVVPEEDLEAGEETNVVCEYEDADGGDTEIIVGLHGAPDGGDVEIPGAQDDEQFIDKDDSEVFTFDEGGDYIVICPEFEGYVLVGDNPIEVNVNDGETESVSCEYSNTGADPYNPDDPPVIGDEESCLTYRDRNLVFTDLNENQIGYAEAQVLKNTAFSPQVTNENIEEAVENFPLSGFGSNITGNNITQSRVDLPGRATRMQVTLLTMQLYCLPIFQGSTLPDERIDGEPMPEVTDLPQRGTVAYDVIKTAFFYGILEGYNYPGNRNHDPSVANTVLPNQTITNWQLMKVVNNAQQNWQGYQNISDFNLARQYGFDSNDWVYTFVARALRKHYPDTAILQVPTILRNFERNIIRGEMIAYLWHSVVRDGVYYPEDEDEAWDAYEDLI